MSKFKLMVIVFAMFGRAGPNLHRVDNRYNYHNLYTAVVYDEQQ